jgi:hypothetical protein
VLDHCGDFTSLILEQAARNQLQYRRAGRRKRQRWRAGEFAQRRGPNPGLSAEPETEWVTGRVHRPAAFGEHLPSGTNAVNSHRALRQAREDSDPARSAWSLDGPLHRAPERRGVGRGVIVPARGAVGGRSSAAKCTGCAPFCRSRHDSARPSRISLTLLQQRSPDFFQQSSSRPIPVKPPPKYECKAADDSCPIQYCPAPGCPRRPSRRTRAQGRLASYRIGPWSARCNANAPALRAGRAL